MPPLVFTLFVLTLKGVGIVQVFESLILWKSFEQTELL